MDAWQLGWGTPYWISDEVVFCAWVDGKTSEKKIITLVRKFRVKKAKMLNGSVSGQIFQPAENSSGAFLTYLTSHPTRSRLIAEKKTCKQMVLCLM